jgi:hypothetical protein
VKDHAQQTAAWRASFAAAKREFPESTYGADESRRRAEEVADLIQFEDEVDDEICPGCDDHKDNCHCAKPL